MAKLAINGGNPIRTKPFPSWPVIDDRDKQAVLSVLESKKWGIGSPHIDAFEKKFAEFCKCKHAISCTNGTDAIYIGLQALGIGAGDEVIIPPYTFIATAIGVLMVNAIPIFADIDPNTYNIDPRSIEQRITPKTKGIIPVHIAGNAADMDAIMTIAQKHNLLVLEDSAQAHGASWKGIPLGSIGHIGTFSFQSSKNLSSGEGGALITQDDAIEEKIRSFVNCGRSRSGVWYEHHELAGNHRFAAFQAALLLVGLERIEEQIRRRSENACHLVGLLNQISGVKMTESYPQTTRHAYHLGILRYHAEAFKGLSKTKFIEAMQKEGIDCSSGYMPLYKYHFFRHFREKVTAYKYVYNGVDYDHVECPVCDRVCRDEGVWLTQNMFLGPKEDMDDIAAAIQKIQDHADELI